MLKDWNLRGFFEIFAVFWIFLEVRESSNGG